ncbi:unnamed protein product [Clonostachys solani]|uniref:Rhodopsin domain-containing protein n=1 Tax=Clonostachys solani TaxID=160281 RepID=A0A9N9Z114_9HYPO|nr:unnamed protein product [Clonostachys solani]
MPGLPSPPDDVDLTADKRPMVIGASVATWILAVFAVLLRIISRKIKGLNLWYDDWLVVAALIPAVVHVSGVAGYGQCGPFFDTLVSANILEAVSRGVGQHVWVASPEGTYAWAIGLFIGEICYTLTLLLVKLAILAFYWRSFSIKRSVKIIIWILVATTSGWAFSLLVATFLQCIPTRAFWERFNPYNPLLPSEYHCGVDSLPFFIGNAIPNIVTDIVMIILPIPYIWSLQLPVQQKLALGGVFVVGIFVTIVSLVRLIQVINLDLTNVDITWNFASVGTWTIVEGNVAILCACLPFLKPIINKITYGRFGSTADKSVNTKGSSKPEQRRQASGAWGIDKNYGGSTTYVRSNKTDERPFTRLDGDESDQGTSGRSNTDLELQDMRHADGSPDGILVVRDVIMETEHNPKSVY